MIDVPAVIDTDTLSEISRGSFPITARVRGYVAAHGRLTVTAISVFERLRGYRAAIRAGRPFEEHLRLFKSLLVNCVVLPFDERAADRAAEIWAALGKRARRAEADLLIAATASIHGMPLVTRNHRDFAPIAKLDFVGLHLVDWSR